ncbi:hypothetical protein AB205_0002540 [Aquarana catesbeiana]|uniref:Uncharacterized protein n=1 Tax=Aquarana catesbeiana TaxID=8400 RepID=A0A2G9Q5A8_AQUCT|nr:hypothetical protein AB205_0002540 [Aquarana catesbeiana]
MGTLFVCIKHCSFGLENTIVLAICICPHFLWLTCLKIIWLCRWVCNWNEMQTRFCVRRGHSAAVYTSGRCSTSVGHKNTLFIRGHTQVLQFIL